MMKRLIAVLITFNVVMIPIAQAESFGSVSHIHAIKAAGDKVLIGTHEGLFTHISGDQMNKMGKENFDVMGLAVDGSTIYASGHPGAGSNWVNPIGLLKSTDGGKSWAKISLEGKVDFHLLEVSGTELYGADSGSGQLMYSSNSGKSWKKLGKNQFTEISPVPGQKKSAFAVKDGKLFKTTDAFATTSQVKTKFTIATIEYVNGMLYAGSGKSLYHSTDMGKSWMQMSTFKRDIGLITASDKLLVVIAGNEILKSTNAGESFK